MAKKRLNKKVALIGAAVFLFLVLIAIGAILYFSRDPEKFIRDGDVAMKAADEAVDEQIKAEEYEKAVRNYNKARNLAKTDSLRIEMLFKLADVHVKTKQWRPLMGCWNTIIRIDPENVKARLGRLEYVYITADSGIPQLWQEVASQASEFIEVAEDANLLMEDTAKWRTFEMEEKGVGGGQIGPYLYLLRGRATFEIARLGAVTDPDESLARAIDDLEKVRELEPGNVDVYWHLARAAITKGQILASRGNFEERDKAIKQAEELLEQAVEVAGADPEAHINLLRMKLILAGREGREQLQSLEPEYLSLVQKFATSADAYSALARFYQLRPENIDKAIEAAEKAVELDKENVAYAITKASLYYRNFSIHGQKQDIYKAIEVAKNALTLPDAQDKPGPRQLANRRNRIMLCGFLANCYIEQMLEPCEVRTDAQRQVWMANAEQAVHEIEQLSGSGESPDVIKWRGMLELAKGNRPRAIKNLYAAYEQLKASGRADALLSYVLAKVFADTAEVGAVTEFLVSALNARIAWNKPEVVLDYAEVLLKLNDWTRATSIIDVFEEDFGANEKSQMLRIQAYIGAKKFDEVEEELAKMQPDDPDAIKINMVLVEAKIRQAQRQKRMEESSDIVLQTLKAAEKEAVESEYSVQLMTAELKSYRDTWAGLLEKLLTIEPNSVDEASIVAVCDNYIAEGKIERARAIVNRFLEYFPDSIMGLFYKQILFEPEPDKISQQRRNEIEKQVLSNIAEPMRRSLSLGIFYRRNNEPNEAAIEFKKVLKIETSQEGAVEEPVSQRSEEIADMQRLAAGYLFDIALGTKDWELASAIGGLARRKNFDDCEGRFFAARLAVAKEQYKDALAELEECLRQRPVFSHGFRLRSNINAALGNEHASIEDAQKAASWNPLNGDIAKVLAFALYRRNERLGDNVSSDQIIETRAALDRAVALNLGDLQLLSSYAEYISQTEPLRALAIRQSLQEAAPSVRNAVLLGRLATKMAIQEKEAERKEALFAIAASSFEQAREIDPYDRAMLYEYAEYYQVRGQDEKARLLLLKSEDQRLLWSHYIRNGEFEDAREVLERLYESGKKEDSSVVKGLLLVAEKTADRQAAKKYSEELLLLEDNVENHLIQIQTFLRIGLIKEAEYKLQGLKEKYPDEPRSLLLEAWLAMKQGQLKRALELTNRNLETDQDNAVAWRLRGRINFFMANYEQAIIDLKRSKLLSDELVTRIILARAYLRVGRGEDAITELKNTIDEPGAPMEGRILLEQIYLRLGRGRALEKLYDETLEKFADSVPWYNRAGGFAIAKGEFGRAEKLFNQALQNSRKYGSTDSTALDGYLRALVLSGRLDKVFEEGRKYVDGDFAPIAFFRMAQAKMRLGDRTGATEYCRRALDKAGTKELFVTTILREMYVLLGVQEVSKYCKERLQADPDSLIANWTMFNLVKISGEYNKAVGYIDRCLEVTEPNSPDRINYVVEKAEILRAAYNKTSDTNYLKRSIIEYESLLTKVPNNTDVLNNLAYMLAQNDEKLALALEYAKRAHEVKPNNPDLLDTYSYVLYKNGRTLEAAEFLHAALQQYEQNKISVSAEVYEHLGIIKEELGATAEALAAYEQALEAGVGKFPETFIERMKGAVERLRSQGENNQIEGNQD